jgi:gamma-glutamylcyclotransferase (GGCT)/AIG2-like uncharacterized protein YtfP
LSYLSRSKLRGIKPDFRIKGYPALVPGETWVRGELLELEDFDEILKAGDLIEGYGGPEARDNEYDRRVTEIETSGGLVQAWVYWYGREDLGSAGNPVIFIRGEGLIPRRTFGSRSAAVIKVLNPRPIPYENNIPHRTSGSRSAARLLIRKSGLIPRP